MTPKFQVVTTSHFDRAFRKLARRHPQLARAYAHIVNALQADPYNHSRSHDIKKLEGVSEGNGQYRIRAGRFRFRYDAEEQVVYLKTCALRREGTYN